MTSFYSSIGACVEGRPIGLSWPIWLEGRGERRASLDTLGMRRKSSKMACRRILGLDYLTFEVESKVCARMSSGMIATGLVVVDA